MKEYLPPLHISDLLQNTLLELRKRINNILFIHRNRTTAPMQVGSRTCSDLAARPHRELRRTIRGSHVETVRLSSIAAAVLGFGTETNGGAVRKRIYQRYAHLRRWLDVPVQLAFSLASYSS